jgi:uncharacterized protein YukE
MEVSPSLLHTAATALAGIATEVRSACRAGTGSAADRAGPGDPLWATDAALSDQATAWDGHLGGLADRLDDLGRRLREAADGYYDADRRAGRRLGVPC